MSEEHWNQSQELFHELIDLTPDARRARLDEIAGTDLPLAEELEQLLLAAAAERPIIEQISTAVDALLNGPDLDDETVFGPYRIKALIGRGGMGTVYRAVRDDTGQDVAIKVLNLAWTPQLDRDRFTREQRTLARLNHAFIAHLYDADTFDDGTPWFAMEYVRSGLPITEYCRDRNLDIADRLQLFRDVCQAVRHAHRQAIIHRDLKPSNILVSDEGVIKLVDFGIAMHLEEPGAAADQPQLFARSLTPASAAPEQLTGDPVGLYTDIYALGNVLFELLTGARPFDLNDRSLGEIRTIVVEQAPPKPSSVCATAGHVLGRAAWRELDAMCLTLLQKEPLRRYPSVETLITDLDHFTKREPLLAHPNSWWYRGSKFVKRHASAVAAAAATAVLIAALTISYTIRLAKEHEATLAQAARTDRLQQFMLGLFSGEEPEAGPARDLTVRKLLERGVLTAESLGQEPDIRAELKQTLGSIFEQLGDLERAETLMSRSLEDKASRLSPKDPRVIEGLVMLSLLRTNQTKLDEAERLAKDALARINGTLPPSHPLSLRASLALGKVLTARGKYTEAIATLDDTVRRYDRAQESADGRLALTELANAHQYAGHLEEADRLNARALEVDRRVHGGVHPDVAEDLLNLAAAASTRGQYAAAEKMDREALAIFEQWYGPDHPETGSAAMILGQQIMLQGRLDEAAPLLYRARDVFMRTYPGAHRRIGLIHNEIGILATRRERYDEAIESLTEALKVYRQVYPDGKSQYVSVGLGNLGTAYLEKKQYLEAERLLREAVTLSTELLSKGHSNTAIAQLKLGRVLVRQQRYAEALPFLEEGYATLSGIAAPSVSWLQRSREDLATAYERLGRTDDAGRFRAALHTPASQ